MIIIFLAAVRSLQHLKCGMWDPQPVIEPMPCTAEMRSLNHWEVPKN